MKIKELMKLVEQYAKDYNNVDGWSGKVLSSSIIDQAHASRTALINELEKLINNQKPELNEKDNKEDLQTSKTPKKYTI